MELRTYQTEARTSILTELEQVGSTLLVLPTGCLSGDTAITLNRGGKGFRTTLAKAFRSQSDPRRKADIPTMIRSEVGGRIGLHRAFKVLDSGEKETATLTLENGKSVRGTLDHQILTTHGFVAMADLHGEHEVVCESEPFAPGKGRKRTYRQVQGLRFHPYANGVVSRRRKGRRSEGRLYRVPVHRLVAEAGMNGISVDRLVDTCRNDKDGAATLQFLDPAVWAVHHHDENTANNKPSNLHVVKHGDHQKLHAPHNVSNLGRGWITSSKVKGVTPFGVERTYDVVCDDPHHNFVANGMVVHNCGKTIVFASLIDHLPPGRVLVLAHREELIRQAAEKIEAVTGHVADMEMAGYWADGNIFNRSKVIVSSVQTQVAGRKKKRMERFDPSNFALIIVDEAHHATAKTYRKIIDYYRGGNPQCKVLGVTATPDRGDNEALGQVFDSVAYQYGIEDAVNDGWLTPIQQRTVMVESLDFSNVRTTAGDLNGADLAKVMEFEESLHAVVNPTIEVACGLPQHTLNNLIDEHGADAAPAELEPMLDGQPRRRTLVFATSVKHAERLCEIANRWMPDCARFICGKTQKDERQQILEDFAAGRFQIVVNVGVLTEGFDDPGIELIVLARPTKSRALFVQMVGRGTRPLPGIVDGIDEADERRQAIAGSAKPCVEVMDFVGNVGRHKLVSVADILGGKYSDEAKEKAKDKAKAGAVNMADALAEAEQEIEDEKEQQRQEEIRKEREAEERERKRREKVLARARYSSKRSNPFDVLDIDPVAPRSKDVDRLATKNQAAMLERNGIKDAEEMSFTEAKQLIDEIIERRNNGMASFKQVRLLNKYGLDAKDMTFDEAGAAIGQLKANGWKRPADWGPQGPQPVGAGAGELQEITSF